jgi:hypothetical protein
MPPRLTLYIDEAGDPGVRDGLKYSALRHEWLCLAGAVVRSSREAETIDWVREMRGQARSRQSNALHYHRITSTRRHDVCAVLGQKSLRGFCMASHKTNLRSHFNERLGRMARSDQFYNWCVRLLFERLSEWNARLCRAEGSQVEPIKVVFAERGGHDYDHMFAYFDKLRMQIENGTLFLRGKPLAAELLRRDHWTVERAETLAGLQIADTIASAFYQAANTASPSWDLEPARALRPIMAKDAQGDRANAGVTVWPLAHQSQIPDEARAIFRDYGYRF